MKECIMEEVGEEDRKEGEDEEREHGGDKGKENSPGPETWYLG